jgi:hypothetical protein
MVGLDAAGKTTILYKLKLGEGEYFRPLALYNMDISIGIFSGKSIGCTLIRTTWSSHSLSLLVNLVTTL